MNKHIIAMTPMITLLLITIAASKLLTSQNDDSFTGKLRPVPNITIQTLADETTKLDWTSQAGKKIMVNFWASWCAPCRLEHPLLMQLAAEGVHIDGIAYKDQISSAQDWLRQYGDPYARRGTDPTGDVGLAFGVAGVPETFLIDEKGYIIHVHRGPLDNKVIPKLRQMLLP